MFLSSSLILCYLNLLHCIFFFSFLGLWDFAIFTNENIISRRQRFCLHYCLLLISRTAIARGQRLNSLSFLKFSEPLNDQRNIWITKKKDVRSALNLTFHTGWVKFYYINLIKFMREFSLFNEIGVSVPLMFG
jgi:hypothetical protein